MTEPAHGTERSTPFGADRDPGRVVALSDGVMAISVTLLVLEIRPPKNAEHMLRGLVALWPSYRPTE